MRRLLTLLILSSFLFTANAVASDAVAAEEGQKKVAKTLSCKQQAKKAGIKNKKKRAAFIKECKAKRMKKS